MRRPTRAGRARRATPELFAMVASRFRALAEPTRLVILHALKDGERTVGELGDRTGLAQGNLSKHLQQLFAAGFVTRQRDGLFVRYALADEQVLHLCELMCDHLEHDASARHAVLVARR